MDSADTLFGDIALDQMSKEEMIEAFNKACKEAADITMKNNKNRFIF